MNKFEKFCKDTRFFNTLNDTKVCQPLISGGYGVINALKYAKKETRGLTTSDIDIHYNVPRFPTARDFKTLHAMTVNLVKAFCSFANIKYEDVEVTKLSRALTPVPVEGLLNVQVHRLYLVLHKGVGLFDIAITTEPTHQLDTNALYNTGIPLKKLWAYRVETYSMVMRESIPGLNTQAYKMRHHVTGKRPEKGVKDRSRLKKLCDGDSSKPYCGPIRHL